MNVGDSVIVNKRYSGSRESLIGKTGILTKISEHLNYKYLVQFDSPDFHATESFLEYELDDTVSNKELI